MAKDSGEHREKPKLSSVDPPKEGKGNLLKRSDLLEKELLLARENLHSITEEMETANEDLLRTIEEMQSLNEALITSKEELQATNVEIISLNQQLREKQEQLNATRDHLEAIVSTIKEPLLILDKNLRIKFANQSFYTKFNITEQETKDSLFYEVQNFRWNNKKLLESLEHIVLQKNRMEDFEMILDESILLLNARELLSQKNTEPSILLAIEDVTDSRMAKKLKAREAIGTNTDITEQKNFSETLEIKVKERTLELYEKNQKLERTNAELISFSNISNHDLQEPLRKIQMFSKLILKTEADSFSENALNYFERMQQAANRMQNLIEDLTAYSMSNVKEAKFQTIDLNLIIEDVKVTLSEELEQKDVTFKLNNVCDIKIMPIQFTQVILNLVSNSIKFAKEDQLLVIEIECEEVKGKTTGIPELTSQQDYIHIRISDNGIGFEPQYNERIFEVYQRLHSRKEYTGTGMGLAIVKRIIENHEGAVRANGKLNEGATFDIYIPAH